MYILRRWNLLIITIDIYHKIIFIDKVLGYFFPGLVPGTGLAQNYPLFLKFISDYVFKLLILFHRNVHTAKTSGSRLANLAFAGKYKNVKGKYFEGEKEISSSEDSYNKHYQHLLWTSTVELLKIDQKETSVSLESDVL